LLGKLTPNLEIGISMAENLVVRGLIATDPRLIETDKGLSVLSFRLAAPQRRFDAEAGRRTSDQTNWFSVSSFRKLAENSHNSLAKGDRVLVSGKLKIRDWDNGERSGTSVELDAEAIGHDLTFGTTEFRQAEPAEEDSEDSEAELQPA
jgi:single-strand DNA-binding protein